MRRWLYWGTALALAAASTACGQRNEATRLTLSGSALGPEAALLRRQLVRFGERHPGVDVELRVTPDAADQRHQLYVQWLNARAPDPDVLQIDVTWTAELAGAGWILPLDTFAPDVDDFIPAAIAAARWRGSLYALPWFVDLGLLYWRTDLLSAPPRSLSELRDTARRLRETGATRFGLVWQGARYEGLITVFLEHLSAFGGGIVDGRGRVIVDEPAAVRALTFMCDAIARDGFVPASVLTWQEEQTRFAFQNGDAAFMRNWPYAWGLLQDSSQSRVAGRFAVAPFPGEVEDGRPTAALGGAQLAVNAWSANPSMAWALVGFLTAPEQMLERARVAGQLPSRRSLYDTASARRGAPDSRRGGPPTARRRGPSPRHARLQRALRGSAGPASSCAHRAGDADGRPSRGCTRDPRAPRTLRPRLRGRDTMSRHVAAIEREERRLARWLVAPALLFILVGSLVPIAATGWEALHGHDLRLPWLGRPFVGLANFMEATRDPRFTSALLHTVTFAAITVPLELALGLALALLMHAAGRGRALIRLATLLPWAIPTVVAALVWRFMFDAQAGIITAPLRTLGLAEESFDWFVHPLAAWVPIGGCGHLEDDAVCRDPPARGPPDDRPGAPRGGTDGRRRRRCAGLPRSPCRSSGRRSSWRLPFACSTRCVCSIWPMC